jgi:hypothetical protein
VIKESYMINACNLRMKKIILLSGIERFKKKLQQEDDFSSGDVKVVKLCRTFDWHVILK